MPGTLARLLGIYHETHLTFYFTILKNKNKNTILFLAGGEADDASSLVEVPRIPTRTILTIVPLLFNIEYQILPLPLTLILSL